MSVLELKRRRLVGVAQGAERLGLSVWTLRSWCYAGRCSSHKIGSRLMVDEEEIEKIIRESERPRVVPMGRAVA